MSKVKRQSNLTCHKYGDVEIVEYEDGSLEIEQKAKCYGVEIRHLICLTPKAAELFRMAFK